MRVLVTSASRKLPLLRAIAGQLSTVDADAVVTAADADAGCLAAYAWRPFVTIPPVDEAAALLTAVTAVGAQLVIATRDADAAFFAARAGELHARGVWCLGGPKAAVEACSDKLAFAEVLAEAGVPVIATTTDPALLAVDRLVVKERRGAGSLRVGLDLAPGPAAAAAAALVEPVFQPFVPGPEVSIDAYRARDGRVLGLVARTRDLVVGGESQVSTTVDAGPYEALATTALTALGLTGHAVLQAIVGPAGPTLVECNPRLGGASTLSLAAGLRSVQWAWLEAAGRDPGALAFEPAEPGLRLVRSPADEIGRVGRVGP